MEKHGHRSVGASTGKSHAFDGPAPERAGETVHRPRNDVVHGRGAQSGAPSQRFGLAEREADGDWRDAMEALDGPPVKLRTTVTEERPKSILTFNQSPDIGFDRSVNAYRGCEHGCIYCFARPTHAYHDLSPGLDFETKLFAKPNAAELLRATLARPRYRPGSRDALDDVSHGVESGNGTAGPVGAPDFTPATVSDAQWYLDGWNMG